jgi:hypothetical protein
MHLNYLYRYEKIFTELIQFYSICSRRKSDQYLYDISEKIKSFVGNIIFWKIRKSQSLPLSAYVGYWYAGM